MTEKNTVLGMGDIHIAKAPCKLTTYLGSCIAVCLYVPSEKIGGMAHVVIPELPKKPSTDEMQRGKYAETSVEELLKQLKKQCKEVSAPIEAKIFGGAKVIKQVKRHLGRENEIAVVKALKQSKIIIKASRTGGEKGYRVEFDLDSGNVLCQSFGENPKEY